jgi:hypothetical protein
MVLTQLESLPRRSQKSFLVSLTQNQSQDFVYEVDAKLFFFQSKPDWYPGFTARAARRLKRLAVIIQHRIDAGLTPAEKNANGSTLTRETCLSIDLFFRVYLQGKSKIEMIYQDGFSVAAAVESELKIYTYCEGDVIITNCPSRQVFLSEKIQSYAFYQDNY